MVSRRECKMEANGVEGNDVVEVNNVTTGMQNGHVWCGSKWCHDGNEK